MVAFHCGQKLLLVHVLAHLRHRSIFTHLNFDIQF
jgi:solute carrier family 25 aspartate/glutamate transporter 12/13